MYCITKQGKANMFFNIRQSSGSLLFLILLWSLSMPGFAAGQVMEDAADKALAGAVGTDEEICIYVMTDPHYLSPELTDGGASFLKTVRNGDSKPAYAMGETLDLSEYREGIRLWQEQPVSNVSLYLLSLGG
jgi:hypothetical protein